MPIRSVVQDFVDVFSPSHPAAHGEVQSGSRDRNHSLPSRLPSTHASTEPTPGIWYKDAASRKIYHNPAAMDSSSTYYSALSSLPSIRSRRSFLDLGRTSSMSKVVANAPSRSHLTLDAVLSTVSLAPAIEEKLDVGDQTTGHADDVRLACSPEISSSIPTPAGSGSDPGRITPTAETTSSSSGRTVTAGCVSGANPVVASHEMTSADMFQRLVDHGCHDLTPLIDGDKYSSCRIAEGGFGDIWKGQLSDGRFIAVKVMRCALMTCTTDEKKGLKRMMREIYTWSKLDHENIHKLMGVTMLQGRLGVVSEWMPNGNLRDYLRVNPNTDRYELCVQIAQAVKHIHDRNMVHGDLKACNVLVSPNAVAKLTDFDYSVIAGGSLLFTDTTRVGGGTFRWMAPELIMPTGSHRSKITDVYALGMTFLEIITGALPYYPQCSNEAQVIFKVAQGDLPERSLIHFADHQQGNTMWKLLTHCWAYAPASRPTAQFILDSVSSCSRLRG